MKRLYWLTATVILCVSSNAFAFRVSSSPASMTLYLNPGKSAREVIELKNEGSRPVGLRVYATGYFEDEKGEGRSERGKLTAEKWFSVAPTELTLNPMDYGIIRYEVKIPEAPPPAPGTYGATVMIEQKPDFATKKGGSDTGAKATGIRVLGSIGHVVAVNIGKITGYDVKLESFDLNKEKTNFLIKVRNSGNFLYAYRGELKIYSGDKKIKEIRVPAVGVWPGSVKTRKVKVPKDLKPGTYSADLNIGGKEQGSLNAKINFTISS